VTEFRPFRPLVPGDRVAVVAASSPIQPDMLARGLAEVRALGLEPAVAPDVDARERFCAGPDARRERELSDALRDESVRAVWLARGGYGVTPLLRRLDPRHLQADPKPIVGESDGTALGCWALQAGVAWVHGPMVASTLRLGADGYERRSLTASLFGAREGGSWLEPASTRSLAIGTARGAAWGGCLSLLSALAGTPWLPRVRGGVLVVEDTGVKPYQVHRMLVQLRDAGCLEDLAGVVAGDFEDCVQHADQGYSLDDVLADFFRETAPGVPVTVGWPVGHSRRPHLSIPLGLAVALDVGSGGARLGVGVEGGA
jgi:muramoyltetrapeptide carboxypeptidase